MLASLDIKVDVSCWHMGIYIY